MNFQQLYLNSLKTNTNLSDTKNIKNYLPDFLPIPEPSMKTLPYIDAFGNFTCSYPYNYELSYLNSYCFLYSEYGSGHLIIDNQCYDLVPGTLAILDCKQCYQIEINQSPWNYKVIYLNGNPVPYLYQVLSGKENYIHTFSLGSSIPSLLNKIFFQLEKNPHNFYLNSKYLFDIMMEVILEKKNNQEPNIVIPDYLIEIKQNFDDNYQKSFTLDDLEREYHISKYRICHEFTKQYGVPPIQYLNQKRIEVAKDALIHTDKRIYEIGCLVGIENTNHFIRLFKKETGVTPLVFRKSSPVL